MTDHVLAHVEDINSALDMFIDQTNIPAMTIDEVRLSILKEFEENDKKRGVPYLAHTPKVSDTVRIEYTDKVEFGQDEEPFVVGVYSDDFLNGPVKVVQPTGVVKEAPFTDQNEYNSLVEAGLVESDEESKWSSKDDTYVDHPASAEEIDNEDFEDSEDSEDFEDSEDYEESESADEEDEYTHEISPLDFLSTVRVSPPDPVKATKPIEMVDQPSVATEPVRPKKIIKTEVPPHHKPQVKAPVVKTSTQDAFDEFDTMFARVSKSVEKKVVRQELREPVRVRRAVEVTEAKTVRELVKNNPGCTIEFAKQFFPEREIKKQISVGRIYYKNGKLTI